MVKWLVTQLIKFGVVDVIVILKVAFGFTNATFVIMNCLNAS